jgi:hypothetical protein
VPAQIANAIPNAATIASFFIMLSIMVSFGRAVRVHQHVLATF